MDDLARDILSQLLAEEKESAPTGSGAAKTKTGADHWTPAVLLERAAYLRKMARHGEGSASETLKDFPRHAAMLSVRNRDGMAEQHAHYADLFYVLDGRATLVTGGTIVGGTETEPGEIRGVSIEGGRMQELRSGDLAHVPAGMPHQMLVPGEKTFTSFVLKIQETE
jgi:mannose-6-phosphate isomerase-like protein (cupin superfamily)